MSAQLHLRFRAAARSRGARAALALIVLGVIGTVAHAELVLHEYLPADAAEDLRLGATTTDGTMAAAIDTHGGAVTAPELDRASERRGSVYGSDRSPPGSGRRFHADPDTSRPDSVSYDDPFTPSLAPYKRELAYDGVDERFDLVVREGTLVPLVEGGAPRTEDDQFYADLPVDVVENEVVRIPTVGPGARLLALRSTPTSALRVFRDGADNWFLEADRSARLRLVLHVAVDRAVFGSPFADVEWPRLWRFAPPIADRAKTEGVHVARQIGVVDGTGPSEALRILVKHFRGFAPSPERPKASAGVELYRELTLSQKGVCRHRAYAFTVTALALGIPTRFVSNEAHAWVEVFDATRWHRVDLGGAADRLDTSDANRIPHQPPRDPFAWPSGSDSGQAMADRARSQAGSAPSGGQSPSSGRGPPVAPSALLDAPAPPDDPRPKSQISLVVSGTYAKRGARIHITGSVDSSAGPCVASRVDLVLVLEGSPAGERLPLGTLVTSPEGRYDGHVVVPYNIPPGDYVVRATTPGNLACGAGESP